MPNHLLGHICVSWRNAFIYMYVKWMELNFLVTSQMRLSLWLSLSPGVLRVQSTAIINSGITWQTEWLSDPVIQTSTTRWTEAQTVYWCLSFGQRRKEHGSTAFVCCRRFSILSITAGDACHHRMSLSLKLRSWACAARIQNFPRNLFVPFL
jgi:hypothetical protein